MNSITTQKGAEVNSDDVMTFANYRLHVNAKNLLLTNHFSELSITGRKQSANITLHSCSLEDSKSVPGCTRVADLPI